MKVYLKFQINPAIPRDTNYFNADGTPKNGEQMSDAGNWKKVSGHRLRIAIVQITTHEGTEFTGAIGDYATLIDQNGNAVENIEAVTTDGAAQVNIKAGDMFEDVKEVVVSYEDETEE